MAEKWMLVTGQNKLNVFCSDSCNMYWSQHSTFGFNVCFAYWVQTKITCSLNTAVNDWLNIESFCVLQQHSSNDGSPSAATNWSRVKDQNCGWTVIKCLPVDWVTSVFKLEFICMYFCVTLSLYISTTSFLISAWWCSQGFTLLVNWYHSA